ncbi:hypothetical protein WICMUC_002354 [Wickerhamomyces mucosus]|uniref:FMN hydroxy acid dehydrogenase domain-containing protein n=1 Tax=Wickerhamomyces mucosus TaxID=1378264 RepID=A0A9P8PQ68_9ASCO|nr:hypothetical protein WICMUC_002354 [Wickerhamomyces mucosus]
MTIEIKDTDSIIIGSTVYKISDLSQDLKNAIITKLEGTTTPYLKPDISQVYNVSDFDTISSKILSKGTYSYYRTGAEDEITLKENELAFKRIYFKPRILNSVNDVNIKTEILGSSTDVPFYITAFAGANLENNLEGELPLAAAASKANVIQMIPCLSIIPIPKLSEANPLDKWIQIYVRSSIEESLELIRIAEETGTIKTVFFTVDVAQLGRRETESRVKNNSQFSKPGPISSDLNWDHIKFLKNQTKLKVVLKGVQTYEDVIKAIEAGVDGVVISNHGGRQLDTARSPIEILAEVSPRLKSENLFEKIEILIDGGVRRGSDIVKALALGAKGVGIGRPFLYALQSYGEVGASKVIEIFKNEVELTLRLLGVNDLKQLNENYLSLIDLVGNRATSA